MQYHLVAQDPKYSAEQPRVKGLVPGKLELAEFTSSCRFVTEQKAVEGGFLLQAQGGLQGGCKKWRDPELGPTCTESNKFSLGVNK